MEPASEESSLGFRPSIVSGGLTRLSATQVRLSQQQFYTQFPTAQSKGYDIHPPYGELALQAGDTYAFNHGNRRLFFVFDGHDWRLLFERQDSYPLPDDIDHDVVTIL